MALRNATIQCGVAAIVLWYVFALRLRLPRPTDDRSGPRCSWEDGRFKRRGVSLYNQLVHVRTQWNWTYFPRPDPRPVAPCGQVALGVCTLRPPAAAASSPVVVFAFALKAVVQSTFIYRLHRRPPSVSNIGPLPALSMVHIRVSKCRTQHMMSGCALKMGTRSHKFNLI